MKGKSRFLSPCVLCVELAIECLLLMLLTVPAQHLARQSQSNGYPLNVNAWTVLHSLQYF